MPAISRCDSAGRIAERFCETGYSCFIFQWVIGWFCVSGSLHPKSSLLSQIRFAAALGNTRQIEHDVQDQRARHQGDDARNAQGKYLAQVLAEDFQIEHLHQNENKNPINQQDK